MRVLNAPQSIFFFRFLFQKVQLFKERSTNIENGKHKISLTNAVRFSMYFEKMVDYLLKEK